MILRCVPFLIISRIINCRREEDGKKRKRGNGNQKKKKSKADNQLNALRRQQETEARKSYEKQLHQDQAMRSMQLQNGTQSQAGTPFAQPQTPVNNIQSLSLETLSPAQLNTGNNTTAQSSPRTALLQGSQQMQRNQSRSTGIGVGSGSMLPPQSPANRTTTPKPIGVGIGVGVGKATPKMAKEELVRSPTPLGKYQKLT